MVESSLKKEAEIFRESRRAQRIRLQRFGMALVTYGVVTFATGLTTRLGLGDLSISQWATILGVAVFGNLAFFLLFVTGLNLRFPDPSLTREQILYSAFWGAFLLYGLPEARPIVLMFYVPAFSFGMLRLNQRKYFGVTAGVLIMYALVLCLEYVKGRDGFNIEYELFVYAIFAILLIWTTFFGGFISNIRNRLRQKNIQLQKAHDKIMIEFEERKRAEIEKGKLIVKLQDALAEVRTLSGLLPICASCKKIRDDKGYWYQLEHYISDHSSATFSHGICPDCAKKLYPNLKAGEDKKKN